MIRFGRLDRSWAGAALALLLAMAAGAGATRAIAQTAAGDPAAGAKAIAELGAVLARAANSDYERAKWDPIHFKPAIDHARDEACLVCHKEVLETKPRPVSPAGVKAEQTEAWYQTLDTYAGAQENFHWRHIASPYAKQVMNLSCNFCHQGNDPREEAPQDLIGKAATTTAWPRNAPVFTLRKMVNPSETCLRCHGAFPAESMGLPPKWEETREGLESPDTPNGCLTCHAEQFRTVRHHVTYLNAKGIEDAAKDSSDACYGCHGGRSWYRISYPYPRHPWPDMPADLPDWAKDRPKTSDARFALPIPAK